MLVRRVLTHGLVTKPEFNGYTITAVNFDDDTGRYSVELDETSSSFMLKPFNLSNMVRSLFQVRSLVCSLVRSLFQHGA